VGERRACAAGRPAACFLLQSGRPYSVLVTNRDYNNDTAFVDKPDAPARNSALEPLRLYQGHVQDLGLPRPALQDARETWDAARIAARLREPGLQPDQEHPHPLVHSRARADAASRRGVQSDESRQYQQLALTSRTLRSARQPARAIRGRSNWGCGSCTNHPQSEVTSWRRETSSETPMPAQADCKRDPVVQVVQEMKGTAATAKSFPSSLPGTSRTGC